MRLERYHRAVEEKEMPRSLLSLNAFETREKRKDRLSELSSVRCSVFDFGKEFENEDFEED